MTAEESLVSTASTPDPSRPRAEAFAPVANLRACQLGWALAQATLAGATLAIGGPAAVRVAAAFGIIALPGLLGALRAASAGRQPVGLLLVWAAASATAVSVSGGASGPLGAYALAPAAAAAILGARWTTAVALGAAAGAFAAMVQLGGPATPGDPATMAAAAGGSLVVMTLAAAIACAQARPAERPGSAHLPLVASPAPAARPDAVLLERVRAAEAARDEADALSQTRARVLANMSHELRTPLNAIMGFSDIMRTRLFGPLPERYGEYAELIHESGGHLVELINDVLDLSKIDAGRYDLQREIFDMREPIEAALRLMRVTAQDADVELRGALPADAVEVDADRRAIKQIVLNLVSNAIKFTQPGGTATVRLTRTGAEVELQVADTGLGIAAEDIARLGRPFEQTDAGRRTRGSGLGLSLVRAFAQLHGGEMSVESRLGHGSTIGVRLPVAITASPAPV